MLAELRFVQGAIGKKDLVPALTHFKIKEGYIHSFNGTLSLRTPIKLDIDCAPKAAPFIKAIQNCNDTVSLSMTPAGRLSIKSGSFKAFIECVDETTPHVEPDGQGFEINGEGLLTAIQTLAPFVGDDASRPWSNGILLSGQSAYATNNIILAEYWVGSSFPIVCCIPRSAIKEMVRIGEAPVGAQATDHSITFHYEGGRWLRTALLSTEWPSVVATILAADSTQMPLPENFFEGLETIKPFSDDMGRVFFIDGMLRTSTDEGVGATFDVGNLPEGIYQIEKLASLAAVVKTIDLAQYPKPALFYGENLRGAIIGMRLT